MTKINLNNFSITTVALVHLFNGEPTDVEPLAQVIHHKTGGHSFFLLQFVLQERGLLLAVSLMAAHWLWDLSRIVDEALVANVVDLVSGKIRALNERTQTASI